MTEENAITTDDCRVISVKPAGWPTGHILLDIDWPGGSTYDNDAPSSSNLTVDEAKALVALLQRQIAKLEA
jgi:hypothetical protein